MIAKWKAQWPHGLRHSVVFLGRTSSFPLTVPLSTQVYKMGNGKFNAWGNPTMDKYSIQREVEILLVASCYRNWDKLWPKLWVSSPVCRL